MLHAALLLKAEVEDRLHAATGMLLADNEALLNLAHADSPMRMSDIAERLVLSRGGTTKVIDRLEESGLVGRATDPTDRRALVVQITPEGLAMLDKTRPVVDEALRELWARHLTDEEAGSVLSAVTKVHEGNTGGHH